MKIIEGWIVETINGQTFRLLITNGHYAGIWVTLSLYKGPWYAIKTTDLTGSEEKIIDSINNQDQVTIKTDLDKNNRPVSFQVINKNGNVLFTDKSIRVFEQRVYRL
jgi:hypothetical protein